MQCRRGSERAACAVSAPEGGRTDGCSCARVRVHVGLVVLAGCSRRIEDETAAAGAQQTRRAHFRDPLPCPVSICRSGLWSASGLPSGLPLGGGTREYDKVPRHWQQTALVVSQLKHGSVQRSHGS